METVSREIIAQAVNILGQSDDLTDKEVDLQVGKLVSESLTVRRLVDYIPEAFGMVLISHMGKNIITPATFHATDGKGKSHSFPFSREPVFTVSLEMAQGMYQSGPRAVFVAVAQRSSMLDTINKALTAGANIEGATMSGPAMIGIPAEIYLEIPVPFWKRLFGG